MSSPFLDITSRLIGALYLQPFRAEIVDGDGGLGSFATSQAKTVVPTLDFRLFEPQLVQSGIITRISYRLNPTNAVTYILRIWDGVPPGASANAYNINVRMLYESPALQADDTDYDVPNQSIAFVLKKIDGSAGQPFRLYYTVEWTGAPGVTPGYVKVEGVGAYV